MLKRLLATTLAGAALAAGSLTIAAPAYAGPEDGQGCVGTPTMRLTYVCVISVNPGAAVPTVTTTPVPVTVPPVCYFAGCTQPTTVNVPVPTAGGSSGGSVIVLWHNGSYYPIAVSAGGVVTTLVQTVDTTLDTAEYYAAFLVALVGQLDATVQDEVNAAYYMVIKNPYVRTVLALVNDPYGSTCDAINAALYRLGFSLAC